MRAEGPLIFHPGGQSNMQRLTFGALTALIWAGWIYLWLPLVTTLLWIIGVRFSFMQLFMRGRGFDGKSIGLVALACFCAVVYWSSFNYLRFRRKTRRKGAPAVSRQEVGYAFNIESSEALAMLLCLRQVEFQFDPEGRIIAVRGLRVDWREPALVCGAGAGASSATPDATPKELTSS